MAPRKLNLKGGAVCQLRQAGDGPPLVLIHGVGLQSAAWAPQIEALSATHLVLAVDMPGHGGSDPLPGRPELTDYVAWAGEVIEALGQGPVALAGHSMGALIAGGLTVERPDLVSRVALLNGVFRRSAAARAAVMARAEEIARGLGSPEAALERWFSPDQHSARQAAAQWLAQVSPQGYAAAYHAFALGDATYAERFSQIACPLLALTGAEDPNSTPEMSRLMARTAEAGRAVVIEGHRHMVNLTAPEPVNEALQAWLAAQPEHVP